MTASTALQNRLVERRAHVRLPGHHEVRYRAGAWRGGAVATDLSRGGLALCGPLAIALEPSTEVTIELPSAEPPLVVGGHVVATEGELTRVAFAPTKRQAEQMITYLERAIVRDIENDVGSDGDEEAIALLARWYRETGRLAMALELYEGARQLRPRGTRFHETMALFWVAGARACCQNIAQWLEQIADIVRSGLATGSSDILEALNAAVQEMQAEQPRSGRQGPPPTVMLQNSTEIRLLKRSITVQRSALHEGFKHLLERQALLRELERETGLTPPPLPRRTKKRQRDAWRYLGLGALACAAMAVLLAGAALWRASAPKPVPHPPAATSQND
jgi:hypothetical protein